MKNKSLILVAAVLAALILTGVAGFQLAVRRLHAGIEQALGPRASVGALAIGWGGVELQDLRVRAAPKGWPTEDELRAGRVRVVPELSSIFGGAWRVHSVSVDDAYVSVLRTHDGKLHVLPALLERAAVPASVAASAGASDASTTSSGASLQVRIGQVKLNGAIVEFFDASVRQPAHRMRIEQLQTEVEHITVPALDEPLHIDLHGVFKGPQRDGDIVLAGQFTPATRDAKLSGHLAGVDLVALQPYLMRVNEGGVKRGTLDLKFDAAVAKNHLHAPGTVTLTGLELGGGGGVLGTFAGVPRQAVIAAMSRDGRIELQFTLDGRLDDPKFSLNELFATRVAVGLADTLGVSLRGVVEGVGGVIKGLFGR